MGSRAVEADGASAVARAVLAEVYLAGGDLASAQEQAELGLGLDPGAAELHRVRGMLHEAVGEAERAVAEFQAAAKAQPELWLRQQELGRVLLRVARYDEAVLALKSALVLRGKPETYATLGQAYFYLADLDRARSNLEQALSAGATDAGTYGLLSVILAQQDRCDDAAIYLEQALERDPADNRALEATALCGLPSPAGATPFPTVTPAMSAPTATPVPPAPTATPDGLVLAGHIAFPVWNESTGKYDTYLAQPDGAQRTLVATEMHQPSFGPGGQWLALNGERHNNLNLFIARPDGTDQQEITEHAEDGLPHWSPDGNSLVFSSTQHGDKQSRVYVIDEVPFGGGRVPGRPLLAGGIEVLGEFPFWMPDGRIVYSGCDYAVEPARCGLLVVSAVPSADGPQTVTDYGADSAPAAFGKRIAFMTDRDGNWEIYIVNAEGSGLKRLTNRMANDGLPAWSPDGKTIAFVSDQGGVWAMWAMNPDGSNPRKLFDIGDGGLASDWLHERISWGP
jgi:tetratricopeptide (TPR) repeat protein